MNKIPRKLLMAWFAARKPLVRYCQGYLERQTAIQGAEMAVEIERLQETNKKGNMSEKTKERPELSFDGFGINGPDEYRTRLCTFNRGSNTEADLQKYGHLFAAAPVLLEALQQMVSAMWQHFEHNHDGDDEEFDFEQRAIDYARNAIAKAGRQS